jgi:hypothetical protein
MAFAGLPKVEDRANLIKPIWKRSAADLLKVSKSKGRPNGRSFHFPRTVHTFAT